jgi:hypothetical protein
MRDCEYVDRGGTVPGMATRPAEGSRPSRGRGAPAHPDQLAAEQVAAAVTSFALLADPTRVRMLWALRDAGLVEGQRQGQRVVYRLRGGHVRALLIEALFHADHQVSGLPVHN